MPGIAFTSDSFVVLENQTSVDIKITRSGDLNCAGSFHLKTLHGTTDTAALGKFDDLTYTGCVLHVCHYNYM